MRTTRRRGLVALAAAALTTSLFGLTSTASADAVATARGMSFGLEVLGPVEVTARPVAEVSVPGGPTTDSETLIDVPADPVVTSATLRVEGDAAVQSSIQTTLQGILEGQFSGAPSSWNVRGYAITEDLAAVSDTVTADVIESESTATCVDGDIIFGSAARVVNLMVAGNEVPIPNPSPNQVVFDQLGIRIVLWETNWDPATGGLTDGNTVFTNALRVTAPGGIDLTVSHSEATATCAGVEPRGPGDDGDGGDDFDDVLDAPPAAPVTGQPAFTG